MPTLRSSTVFRLLCAAIGILSLGLLGMVGVMVYPSLASGDSATKTQVAKPKVVRQVIKAKEVPIDQNLAQMSEFLYPAPKPDDMSNIWAHAADDFRGWSMIGLAAEGDDKGFVFLQHKPDGRTAVMTVGQVRVLENNLTVAQIHDGMVQISVNGEKGVLKRVGGIAALPSQPAAPVQAPNIYGGGAATWNGTGLPPPPAVPMPTTTPASRVTFRGVMSGSPPAATPAPTPTMTTSGMPTGGPGMFRSRSGRTGRPGNGPNMGGATSGPGR